MNARYRPMAKAWPREKMIAHWYALLAAPTRYPIVHQFAREALAALHAEPAREPGSDDV